MKTYKDYLKEYGQSYLAEEDGDRYITPMEALEDLLEANDINYEKAFLKGLNGWDFDIYYNKCEVVKFNINRDYFYFDVNDNMVSVSEDCFIGCLNFNIDKISFLNWLHEGGYIKKKKYKKLI